MPKRIPIAAARRFARDQQCRQVVILARHGDRSDVGLLGIRCVHGKGQRCTNGAAAGLTIRSLMEPATNIRVGAAVLASKASVEDWNGAGRDGYATRIAAIVAALRGVRVEVKSRRVRKLVDQIAAAVNRERNVERRS